MEDLFQYLPLSLSCRDSESALSLVSEGLSGRLIMGDFALLYQHKCYKREHDSVSHHFAWE